jgi:hypothetical protein
MALSKQSVETACKILVEINPVVQFGNSVPIHPFDPNNEFQQNVVLGLDLKADGGYENIILNVRGITDEQLNLFHEMKRQVPNSSICRDLGNGITRIGWF